MSSELSAPKTRAKRHSQQSTVVLVPCATYRLQLSSDFTIAAAAKLADYFEALGVGAVYLSPVFCARAGSTSHYDVVDPRRLCPALGSEADFERLALELKARGIGLILDLVPNHMGIDDPGNRWWEDVLEHGPASVYARYFDIDWNPPNPGLQNKVLLPVLGDQFGKELEDQRIQLRYADGRIVVQYYDRALPTDPACWTRILSDCSRRLEDTLPATSPERMELESVTSALAHLPGGPGLGEEGVQERYREAEVARRRLATLLENSVEIAAALDETITSLNGRLGDPASFDELEQLLTEQPYRLSYWRVATDDINYRRFFDVDFLAAIRVERDEVFDAVHETALRFVERGWVTGLRIDHTDGLQDPLRYFQRLVETIRASQAGSLLVEPLPYLVAEKILAADEEIPELWPIQGTTGYDFLNLLNGIFIDRSGAAALQEVYARFAGGNDRFTEVLYDSKKTILSTTLSSELYMLSNQLVDIAQRHRRSRDFTRLSLYRTLREFIACFPVYRTYIRPGEQAVDDQDRRRINFAVRLAKRRNPAMSPTFFDFLRSLLLGEEPGLDETAETTRRRFVLRLQQFTGPVMAKGLEDTALYRTYALASVNEVGSDPAVLSTSIEQFHRKIRERSGRWPHRMLATGTHDTKRGEDMRARLNVLSETPAEWEAAIRRWHALNEAALEQVDGIPAPDPNEEYLIYQTLLGTWPLAKLDAVEARHYVERIVAYMDKATKEAKLNTSWLNPHEEYDRAVAAFVRAILGQLDTPFCEELTQFVRGIADAGYLNSLSQTLIKCASPGVCDFYQGTELWDFHLVDPDNRRPVDFGVRRRIVAELESKAGNKLATTADHVVAQWPNDRIKLYVTLRALEFRRAMPELFFGEYEGLAAEGERSDHVTAFLRSGGDQTALVVTPRLSLAAWRQRSSFGNDGDRWPLGHFWQGTRIVLPPLTPGVWRHAMTGEILRVIGGRDGESWLDAGELFARFPVALLHAELDNKADEPL